MDDNNFEQDNGVQEKPVKLTKNEKAEKASREIADVAARGLGRYFGGAAGGAAVDFALNTKLGNTVQNVASKVVAHSPGMKGSLARSYGLVNKYKNTAHQVIDKMGSTSYDSLSSDDNVNDNNNEINGKAVVSGLWNKLPLKAKLIIIAVIIVLVLLIVFLVVFITPLMDLGIIDINGSGGPSNNPSYSYTDVSSNTKYWWPIGSSDTNVKNGITYASGEPGSSYITSEFGPRNHPITGEKSTHTGLDIADGSTPGTTNIVAVSDGTVIYPTDNDVTNCPTSTSLDNCGGGYGNYVMVQHGNSKITLYAHMHQNSITVRAGDKVKQGQVIGKMGSSGNSTGTHLHFEVRENGSAVDPINHVNMDNPRPKGTSINYVSGDSNKQSICLTLKATGFSDNSVAALLTNIKSESSFNPTALGDNGTSYGICQWHNGRYDNLMTAYPDSYHTIDSQIDFLMYELKNKYVSVYNSLSDGTESASDLTYKFCAKFEKPANTTNTCKKRANSSDDYYSYVINGCK